MREAAIDLIGRFLIIHPQLINQYYDVLSDRILVIYVEYLFVNFLIIEMNQIQTDFLIDWKGERLAHFTGSRGNSTRPSGVGSELCRPNSSDETSWISFCKHLLTYFCQYLTINWYGTFPWMFYSCLCTASDCCRMLESAWGRVW